MSTLLRTVAGLILVGLHFLASPVLAQDCVLTPPELVFGIVEIGQADTLEFVIVNEGRGRLTGRTSVDCEDFSLVDGEQDFALLEDESITVRVRFAPETPGLKFCEIDLDQPLCGTVGARGSGVLAPECVVTPDTLEFGYVEVGGTEPQALFVQNVGGSLLTGTLTTDCPDLSIVGDPSYVLAGGEGRVFVIEFSPQSEFDLECGIDTGSELCPDVVVQGTSVLAPICEVPAEIVFGPVFLGEEAEQPLLIRNTGTAILEGQLALSGCPEMRFEPEDGIYSVLPGDSATFQLFFAPLAEGDTNCVLQLGTEACSDVSLTGQGVGQPVCAVEPDTLAFGSVPLGTDSTAVFLVSNTGTGLLSGTFDAGCEEFQLVGDDLTFDVPAGEADSFLVQFSPTVPGPVTCVIGSTVDCQLVVTGTAFEPPLCEVSPTLLQFGEVEVGSQQDLTFTLRNLGGAPLEGEVNFECPDFFLLQSDGIYALGPNEEVTFDVRFAPQSSGPAQCTIDLGSELCGTLEADGTGFLPPACRLDPEDVDFGLVPLGTEARAEVRIFNDGEGRLVGSWIEDCDEFRIETENFGFSLGAGESDTVEVVFAPGGPRLYTCPVATGTNCELSVRGTGDPPPACAVDPQSLDFGTVEVGETGSLDFTVRNDGGGRLVGTVSEICSAFEISGSSPDFDLGGGEEQTFTVLFRPQSATDQVCTIGLGNAECVDLEARGTGITLPECDIFPASLDFGEVEVGTSRTRSFRVSNTGGGQLAGAVTTDCPELSVVGSPNYDLGPGESANFDILYVPTEESILDCLVFPGSGCPALTTEGSATEDPVCAIEASSLSFGDILVGQEVEATFTVTNEGGGILDIDPELDCAGFLLIGKTQTALGAGESEEFTVLFFPQDATTYECAIDLGSSFCGAATATGRGVSPGDCQVDVASVDFGVVEDGEVPERSVTLTNSGGTTISGRIEAGCGPFVLLDSPDYILEEGESATFSFAFGLDEPGVYSCSVDLGPACGALSLSGERLPPPQPECEVSVESIDFGTARTGEAIRADFEIRNVGAARLQGAVVLSGCDSFRLVGAVDFDLGEDETQLIEIEFQPETAGAFSCDVGLGDLCSPVSLRGTASDAVLCQVTPGSLDFGIVEVGQFIDEIVTLENLSAAVLEGALQLPDCNGFIGVGPSAFSLLPGESRQFVIRMEPSEPGVLGCTASFGDAACGTVSLSGEAVIGPACALEPTALDFGPVELGATARRTLTVTNIGGGELAGALGFDCSSFRVVGDSAFRLAAGEESTLTVEFSPQEARSHFCDLSLGNELCRPVSASGIGLEPPSPQCQAEPSVVDFGGVIVGETGRRGFVLRNVGTGPLVGDLRTSCPDFEIDDAVAVELAPGQSREVTVVFRPRSTGPIDCRVEVGDTECLSVSVRGRGEPAPEPICQLSTPEIDFATVPIGLSVERSLTLRNVGGGRLEGSLELGDCDDFQIVGSAFYSLGAGEEQALPVRFLPRDADEVFCEVAVGDRCPSVTLRGRGGSSNDARCLSTPSIVDFGNLELGTSAEAGITVRNDGSGVLIGRLRSSCPEVEVVGNPDFRLNGGAELTWTLRYEPLRLGDLDCVLTLGEGLCADVELRGAAVDARPPLCVLERDELSFGLVAVGERVTRRLALRNGGGGVLSGRLDLCAPYSLTLGSADFSLRADESTEWEIEVAPNEVTEGLCPIRVASCDLVLRTQVIDSDPSLDIVAGRSVLVGAGVVTDPPTRFLEALQVEPSAMVLTWSTDEARFVEPDAVDVDQGLWVQSDVDFQPQWSGQGLKSLHEIEILRGRGIRWHQIANPFQMTVPVSALSVRDDDRVLPFVGVDEHGLEPSIWGWDGTALIPVSAMQSFRGYFVGSRSGESGTSVQLLVDPEAEPHDGVDLPTLPLWQVDVQAGQIERGSIALRMGAVSGDDESLDRHAPPLPATVGLSFGILGAEGAYAYRYLPDEDVLQWDLTLTNLDPTQAVEIDFGGDVPPEARAFLTQWERRRTEEVEVPSTLRLQPIGENMSLRFVVTKTDSIPDDSIPPVELRLNEPVATPNPFVFETDLSMTLEVEGTVDISIYDPSGRRIRDFVVPAGNGEARVRWDGRDSAGESVPAGFYLARFQVGSLDRTLRLVVMN